MFLLLACTSTPSETSPIPSAYEPEHTIETTTIDITSLETGINDSLIGLFSYNAGPLVESYAEIMSYADSYCPSAYEIDGNAFWYGQCQSEQGMSYDGYLFYNSYENFDIFADGSSWNIATISGSSDMVYPDGSYIHWGGNSYFGTGVNPDGMPIFLSLINGSFLDEQDSSWLQDGLSSSLMMYAVQYSTGSPNLLANGVYLNGSIPLDANYVSGIEFQELAIYSELFNYPCEQEPIGGLSVRTNSSHWIDIYFDVDENWTLTGTCDGCGAAYQDNEFIGEICIDASPLLDWVEAPWSTY